jgi:hypothetical protein
LAAYRALNRLAARVLARDPESMLAALDEILQESAPAQKPKELALEAIANSHRTQNARQWIAHRGHSRFDRTGCHCRRLLQNRVSS